MIMNRLFLFLIFFISSCIPRRPIRKETINFKLKNRQTFSQDFTYCDGLFEYP